MYDADDMLKRLMDALDEKYEAGDITEEEYDEGVQEAEDGYWHCVDAEVDARLDK